MDKVTFFKSYADAARKMKDDDMRLRFYDALIGYVFYGEEPDLSDDPTLDIAFTLVRPNVDSSAQKSIAGSSGGRPKSTSESTRKSSPKSTEKSTTESSPKSNRDRDRDMDKEKEGMKILPMEEEFSSRSANGVAAAAKAAPPPACPLCGTRLWRDHCGSWHCDTCCETFSAEKVASWTA